MSKRFIETTIWTQNKWFRKLDLKYKLFWFYLISNCDNVGVWEEDIELVSFMIGHEYDKNEIIEIFNDRIHIMNDKKWWVKDFCCFQYGVLNEDNINNKPHQSYIGLLKKHRLWIDYCKSLKGLKEKDKDKDMVKDKDKDKGDKILFMDVVKLTEPEHKKLIDRYGEKTTANLIERLNNYVLSKGVRYKSHYHTILNWANKDDVPGVRKASETKATPTIYDDKQKAAEIKDLKENLGRVAEIKEQIKESLNKG